MPTAWSVWSVPSMGPCGPCGSTDASARLEFFRTPVHCTRALYEGASQPCHFPRFPMAPRNTTTCIRCRSIYMCFTGLGAADDDDGDTCVREGGRCGTPSFCNRPYDAGSKHVGRHVGLAVHTWIESTVTTYTPTHTKANNTISKKTKRLGMPGTTLYACYLLLVAPRFVIAVP